MKICIDAFGGDFCPIAALRASEQAVRKLDVEMLVSGNIPKLKKIAEENNINLDKIILVNAENEIPIEEEPKKILKEYSNSSMAVGLNLVAEKKADAFVSAGSTGALIFGATFIVKRIHEIKRPVIATSIPCKNGFFLLIDSGANSNCRPEMLVQFAKMGAIYQKAIFNQENARIGLINIGTEDTKGDELRVETYKLLKDSNINFIGNIEARELPMGACDVAVCDGFTGNVILKMTEGLASFFMSSLKNIFYANILTKLSAMIIKKPLKVLKKSFDSKEVGGVPILGVNGVVIKAHGSSDAHALFNAIKQAKTCVNNKVIEEIEKNVV